MKTHNGDMPVADTMLSPDKFSFKPKCELSKREFFAMVAMHGFCSDSSMDLERIPKAAVDMADALLAELDKDGGE